MIQSQSSSFPESRRSLPPPETLAPEPKVVGWRNTALLITLSLYLIFNYGFMLIRIPPIKGGGIPIGEIVLIVSLITISWRAEILRLGIAISLTPLLIWLVYGLTQAVIGFFEHSMWALRDAVHVIESLFLLVGFAFAGSPKYRVLFFRWLAIILCISTLYTLSSPFHREIADWSPKIMNAVGVDRPFVGSYANGYIVMTAFSALLLLRYDDKPSYNIIACLILVFVLIAFQQRTSYGIVAASLLFLGLYRRRLLKAPLLMALALLLLLGAISLLGLEVKGRRDAVISLVFMYDLALASFGIARGSSGDEVWGAAAGAWQRYEWWTTIVGQLTASPVNFLFGLGYGVPLTDTPYQGGVLREPHNSYLSLVARTGVVGLVVWCWLHVHLLSAWNKAYRWSRRTGPRGLQNHLLVMMVYFIAVWVTAIGEDAFEKPYNIIPYYFFWGVVLRFTAAATRDHARRSRRRRPWRHDHRVSGSGLPDAAVSTRDA